jgi:hypothetical protein
MSAFALSPWEAIFALFAVFCFGGIYCMLFFQEPDPDEKEYVSIREERIFAAFIAYSISLFMVWWV